MPLFPSGQKSYAAEHCLLHDLRGGNRLADMALGVIGNGHEQVSDLGGHLLAANRAAIAKILRRRGTDTIGADP